jgi:hypothetical protein
MRENQLPVYATRWAWFPNMFCSFYLVKNHKITKNLITAEEREKKPSYLLGERASFSKKSKYLIPNNH